MFIAGWAENVFMCLKSARTGRSGGVPRNFKMRLAGVTLTELILPAATKNPQKIIQTIQLLSNFYHKDEHVKKPIYIASHSRISSHLFNSQLNRKDLALEKSFSCGLANSHEVKNI